MGGSSVAIVHIILLIDQFVFPDRLFTPLAEIGARGMVALAFGFRLLRDVF